MPVHFHPQSLHVFALKRSYAHLHEICCLREIALTIPDFVVFRSHLRHYLIQLLPASILDDLLALHAHKTSFGQNRNVRIANYFPQLFVHPQMRRFIARHKILRVIHWSPLFRSCFAHLTTLDLFMTCTDALLALIARTCPQLITLNATSRQKRIMSQGGNALVFRLFVTDAGLAALSKCQRLRQLTVNAPRSPGRGQTATVTLNGLRQLLRQLPELQLIHVVDSGRLIGTDMRDVPRLGLLEINHMNATGESLREVLRLCPDLIALELTFFRHARYDGIVEALLEKCPRRLQKLDLKYLPLGGQFKQLVSTLGEHLSMLSLTNATATETYRFEHLMAIGAHCPNLTYLYLVQLRTADDEQLVAQPPNVGQFQRLRTLYLSGHDIDAGFVLNYALVNAKQLHLLKLCDEAKRNEIVDDLFTVKVELPPMIRSLELSKQMHFTLEGIVRLVTKYENLQNLRVHCAQDYGQMMRDMRRNNFMFAINEPEL